MASTSPEEDSMGKAAPSLVSTVSHEEEEVEETAITSTTVVEKDVTHTAATAKDTLEETISTEDKTEMTVAAAVSQEESEEEESRSDSEDGRPANDNDKPEDPSEPAAKRSNDKDGKSSLETLQTNLETTTLVTPEPSPTTSEESLEEEEEDDDKWPQGLLAVTSTESEATHEQEPEKEPEKDSTPEPSVQPVQHPPTKTTASQPAVSWQSCISVAVAVVACFLAVMQHRQVRLQQQLQQQQDELVQAKLQQLQTLARPKEELLREFLQDTTTAAEHLFRTNAPQWHALQWLVHDDPALWMQRPQTTRQSLQERFIIALVMQNLSPYHFETCSVLNHHSVCHWHCPRGDVQIQCNSDGYVTSLSFVRDSLMGTLPTELARLRDLQSIQIKQHEHLRGTLPTELGQLQHLESLEWSSCPSMRGTLPSEWGLLTNLRTLELQHMALDTTVPSQFGNLVALESLALSSAGLAGTLPTQLAHLTGLHTLKLNSNPDLTGTLPFATLVHLDYTYLHNTGLVGNFNSLLCPPTTACSAEDEEYDGVRRTQGDPHRFVWKVADCTEKVICDCCTVCY